MKTPKFWNSKNALSNLLLPFSFLYDVGSTLQRARITPLKLSVPVICIGNLTAGGSGKTPVALHIGQWFKDKNIPAFFLSRGYGGSLAGPLLVDAKKHTAHEVGDEPLLLAGLLPTVVAKDRALGAQFAIKKGAGVIIMDDGFQNPSLVKSLSFVVIDGKIGFGNGRLLPAGPLRETPSIALKRAHAAIIINRTGAMPPLPPNLPLLNAKTQPKEGTALKGKKLLAFCGIAYPQKFFDMLAAAGAYVAQRESFPDHYPYRESDIGKLVLKANKLNATLVTTAKDAVRLPPALRECVAVIDMALAFDNASMLDAMLEYTMNRDAKN